MVAFVTLPVALAVTTEQSLALSSGAAVCGVTKATLKKCIYPISHHGTTDADISSALWLFTGVPHEKNLLNVAVVGDKGPPSGSHLIIVSQLAALPDHGAGVVWLYDAEQLSKRWQSFETGTQNIRHSRHEKATCRMQWCVLSEELVERGDYGAPLDIPSWISGRGLRGRSSSRCAHTWLETPRWRCSGWTAARLMRM